MRKIVVRTDGQVIMTLITSGVARMIQMDDTTYRYTDVYGDSKTFRVKKGSEVILED